MGVIFEDESLFSSLLDEFPSLRQTLKKFDVDIENIRFLSDAGSHGVAFTDGKYVVKLTDDKSEATSSAKIAGQHISGVNQIHYVGRFARETPYHDPTISVEIVQYYLIIQNLLNTKLSPRERDMADIIGRYMEYTKWPFNIEQAIRNIYQQVYIKTHENIISPLNTEILHSILKNVLTLYQYGVKYMDVNSGNIGKNEKGELMIFDLGVSETKNPNLITSIE
jgi:hypothetical protein